MPEYPVLPRMTILLAAAVACITGAAPATAADLPDLDDLRPGLVATYRDATSMEVARLEPAVALAWKADETAHPRLAPSGNAEWAGYLNVLRAGEYRFGAVLRGAVRLRIDGKEVLAAEVKAEAPALQTGAAIRLEAGVHAIAVQFTRPSGTARLETLWQGPQFKMEPVPHDVLFHLPAKVPARLATDRLIERGRFLVEEYSCVACHKPEANDRVGKGLAIRQGPDLSQVGARVYPRWLYGWLLSPKKVRHGAIMPELFTKDEAGKTEAYAVARYLASLKPADKNKPNPPKPPSPNEMKASVNAGQRLFTGLGCIACHNETKKRDTEAASFHNLQEEGARRNFPLGNLGGKTTAENLGKYLLNPLAVDPSGRMPDMGLQAKEANDLARFLCDSTEEGAADKLRLDPSEKAVAAFQRIEPEVSALAAFKKLPVERQWLELGQRLVVAKNCVACHTIAPNKKPLAGTSAKASFAGIQKSIASGCLAEDGALAGGAPCFELEKADFKAIRAFLLKGTKGAGSPAPAYAARVALQRFNCLACHSRDGEGGLTTEIIEELRRYEKAENAEAVSPPPLTGVAHKLRTSWLRQVLSQRGRARPWMGLRMPQFGDKNVNPLPEALAALEGTVPDDSVHKVPLNAAKIEAGRQLVGKSGFGCISCHDIAGHPNSGTRGPDLALMDQRVRFDWYGRWLEQAQRMQPGTRMPTVFADGKSPLPAILDGKPDAQAEAIWAYLSLGPSLPLPDGLELVKGKGIPLRVEDKPVLLRTFMPEAGSRAIAIGFPGGVSTAFDAATCRLAFGWSGGFLDASPVWDGRGGTPAKLLGPRFWTAPPGCPWGVNDSNDPPDFAGQNKDLGWGAPLPPNTVYTGPRHLQFDGYTLDNKGSPIFSYRLDAASSRPVPVRERIEPLKSAAGYGVGRQFTLKMPAQRGSWLLAGETTGKIRLLDGKGTALDLDLTGNRVEIPCADRMLVLPQGGDRIVIIGAQTAPKGAKWVLQKQGTTWQALLHLPGSDQGGPINVGIAAWSPFRDEPGLLKELFTTRK